MPNGGLYAMGARQHSVTAGTADAADALLVARLRLVLAIAVLLAWYVDPAGLGGLSAMSQPLFLAYVLHSAVVFVAVWQERQWAQTPLIHWLDVAWFALLVSATHGVNSYFFAFFFFAILTASFRWGQDEGSRVTVASAAAFALSGLLPSDQDAAADLTRLLFRTSFLLSMGYLCAHWGEAQVRLKSRLALLRDVSQLSNPRFGVDHTLAHVLERTRSAYGASACVLVLREPDSRRAWLRTARPGQGAHGTQAESLSALAAEQLLPFDATSLVLHQQRRCLPLAWQLPWQLEGGFGRWLRSVRSRLSVNCRRFFRRVPLLPWGSTQACRASLGRWRRQNSAAAESVADLLDCQAFISAPVRLRKSQGRLYVTADRSGFSRSDALFLTHIVAQAFPVIESIELLDRMASEAAAQERRKFALDLHDSAVQPYIGLKLALGALCKQAAPDNPLTTELHKLGHMADQVVADLRRYAGRVRQAGDADEDDTDAEPLCLAGLQQQAAQVREFYGIDMDVKVRGSLRINDRLTAEVLNLVREGLSNICRHTLAQRGEIELQCVNGWLGIKIENDVAGQGVVDFTPRSISERALALGGRAHVRQTPEGRTAIHIHIPI